MTKRPTSAKPESPAAGAGSDNVEPTPAQYQELQALVRNLGDLAQDVMNVANQTVSKFDYYAALGQDVQPILDQAQQVVTELRGILSPLLEGGEPAEEVRLRNQAAREELEAFQEELEGYQEELEGYREEIEGYREALLGYRARVQGLRMAAQGRRAQK